jgi:hypothetical protein
MFLVEQLVPYAQGVPMMLMSDHANLGREQLESTYQTKR